MRDVLACTQDDLATRLVANDLAMDCEIMVAIAHKKRFHKRPNELASLARRLKKRGVLNSVRQEVAADLDAEKANKEEQAALAAEWRTLIANARKEKRGPNETETKRVTAIKERIEQLKKEEADLAYLAQNTPALPRQAIPGNQTVEDDPSPVATSYARVRVPAQVKEPLALSRSGKPVFTGQHARRDAVVAATFVLASLGNEVARNRLKEWGIPLRQAMSEGTASAGGYLTPDLWSDTLVKLILEYGQGRKYVSVTRMLSDVKNQPKRTGGLTAYFIGENTAITPSDPTYAIVQLVAKKLAALNLRSSEVSEDSLADLGVELTDELAYALAVMEDTTIFTGDGSGTYGSMTGIVPAVAAQAGALVTAATGQTGFSTITLATCRQMVSKVKRYAGAQLAWYISPTGKSELFDRLLDAGGGNSNSSLAEGAPARFLGFPVNEITVMDSTLGANVSKVVALFGDARMAALFGDRRQISIASSDQYLFNTDQIAIKATERFGFVAHDVGDASNAGAIVGLKTAAS